MQQLQFVEVDESGRLVVAGNDGTRYAVTVDDRLRSALRPRPVAPSSGRLGAPAVSPRDVQAMIRAGQTSEDVAAVTGWELERVRRFEGPVLAEREHVVGLAQRAPVRAQGRTDGSHTLDRRVRERLQGRGVELAEVFWDAARHEAHGLWTVLVIFSAGGRERRAAWHYDPQSRSVEALDDEARWLSEDEQALPGGLAGHPLLGAGHGEDEVAADLMASMRERRQRRSRRGRKDAGSHDPSHLPGRSEMPDEVLPLEDLHDDPDTMGEPPAAHPRGSAPEAAGPELAGPVDREQDEVEASADRGAPTSASARSEQAPEKELDETAATASGAGAEETGVPGASGDQDEEARTAAGQTSPAQPVAPRARGRRGQARRERRRLRMPRLPAAVDLPVEDDPEPEGTFARTRIDPDEVSFEEFFGTDEELDDDELDDDEQPDDEDPPDERPAARAEEDQDEEDDDLSDHGGIDDPDERTEDQGDLQERHRAQESPRGGPEQPEQVQPDEEPDDQGSPAPAPEAPQVAGPSTPSPRKGRTSVPSWDDIMFGSRDGR